MVTFALPGDDGADGASMGTPRSRPPLPFAKRAFASPFAGGSPKRFGTPQSSSARKPFATRDDIPPSSLSKGSIAAARNIFRETTISDSPPTSSFSPSLPSSTRKKIFAPGGTPEPTRTYRGPVAQATPRGMAANTTSKDMFAMKIPSPPSELTGEALTRKVPRDWNSKGSIYADQYLAHLCPPEFDDEQRRQFFCILDLRRLKYAADEIFCKKDWKLNIINFAKEFEKSRSIILLRYGLFEFQNVKPSKEVLKRWRREHGLPEPEEEDDPTPSKSAPGSSKKRKASEDGKESSAPELLNNKSKRRALQKDDDAKAAGPTASPHKNKRKASVSDEVEDQPAKMQKSTPSNAKSLFEKAANKAFAPSSTPVAKSAPATAQVNGEPARSVFTGFQSGNAQNASTSSNIFGHLSDSSAKNSGVEADGESETDSDAEGEDSPAAGQSEEPDNSAAASQAGSSLFVSKPATSGLLDVGTPSAPGTRESTPGRSLFDRVTKDNGGQLLRAEKDGPTTEETPAAVDQTWNPSTTPIKFAPPTSVPAAPAAPAAQTNSLFGNTSAIPSSSLFAPKSTPSPNMFAAAKQPQFQAPKEARESSAPATMLTADKDGDGGESDKENESQGPKKQSPFEAKAPAAQPSFGSNLFGSKVSAPEATKETEPAKPSTNLFCAAKPADKTETTSTTNMFGSLSKPSETATPTVTQPSTLFGAKPSEPEKEAEAETPKPTPSMFGNAGISFGAANGGSSNPFGSNIASTASNSNLFGGATSASSKPLFGSAAPSAESTAPKVDAASAPSQPSATPAFTFGGPSAASKQPLFGGPQSPPPNDTLKRGFDGSPMKQDEPSPAKKAFAGGSTIPASSSPFSFRSQQNGGQPTGLFGAVSNPPATNGNETSTAPANSGSGGFNFNFGGGPTGNAFNNPFASGAGGGEKPAGDVGFSFGASTPGNTSAPSGGSLFGGKPTPTFGGLSNAGAAPAFSFSGAPSQPAQETGSPFGGNTAAPVFGNLQAPPGGASTTGTSKSPFPKRKIAPLKRRV